MCVSSVKILKYSYIFIIFCRLFWAFRAFDSAEGQLELLLKVHKNFFGFDFEICTFS